MRRGLRTLTKEKLLQIFEASPDLTLQEYGNRLGITRERVRQLIAKLGLERQRPKPAGPPVCPECGGKKSYQAKLCWACWCSKYAGPPICPECGGRKSYQAKLCWACWRKSR